jgi:acetyl esterase/lipase
MFSKVMPLTAVLMLLAAATANADGPVVKEVHYGTASPEQQMKVYEPDEPGARIVVLVHGGGWNQQKLPNEYMDAGQAEALTDEGFSVFDINWRQDSSTVRAFPMEVEDVVSATRYAIEHATEYRVDPTNVVLLGFSSGGQLAESAAGILGASARGVISMSGPTNWVTLVHDVQTRVIVSQKLIGFIDLALGCNAKTGPCEESYEKAWSPIFNISIAPAWLLFSAEIDLVPESQQKEMLEALQAAGASATLTVVPGKGHSVTYWKTVEPQVAAFIREH